MCNQGTIYAFDRDARRLKTMTNLLEQRHVTCVEAREKDSTEADTMSFGSIADVQSAYMLHADQDFLQVSTRDPKYSNVTHFLLDPSCSSSGMTAQPISDPSSLQELAANQKAAILHAMRFPSCQRIAYSTCSIYEDSAVIFSSILACCLQTVEPRCSVDSCFGVVELEEDENEQVVQQVALQQMSRSLKRYSSAFCSEGA